MVVLRRQTKKTKNLDFVRVYIVGRGHEKDDVPLSSNDHQAGYCYWVRLKDMASTIDGLHNRHKTYKVLRIKITEKITSPVTIKIDSTAICAAKVSHIKLFAKGPCVLADNSAICGVPIFEWGNGRRYQPRGCSCPDGHKLEYKGFVKPPAPEQQRPGEQRPGEQPHPRQHPRPQDHPRPQARPSSQPDHIVPPAPPPTPLQTDGTRRQAHLNSNHHLPQNCRRPSPATTAASLPATFQSINELVASEESAWESTGTATSHTGEYDLPLDGWEEERPEVPPAAPDPPPLENPLSEPPPDLPYDSHLIFPCRPPGAYPDDDEPSEGTGTATGPFLFSATTTILDGNSVSGDTTIPGTPRSSMASLHSLDPADVAQGLDGMPAPEDIEQDSPLATGFTHFLSPMKNWLSYG